jgi:hypothetical protein
MLILAAYIYIYSQFIVSGLMLTWVVLRRMKHPISKNLVFRIIPLAFAAIMFAFA